MDGARLMRWLFGLHRLSSQLLGAALLLYSVTGVIMVYGIPVTAGVADDWEVQRFREPLPGLRDPEQEAIALGRSFDPRARVDRVTSDETEIRVPLRRPGRHTTVTVAVGASQAEIEVRVPGLAARAGELHGQRRYRGGPAFVLWAALADAAALALLLFAASGVVLAWRRDPWRTAWVFGGASVFTLVAIFQLWTAR